MVPDIYILTLWKSVYLTISTRTLSGLICSGLLPLTLGHLSCRTDPHPGPRSLGWLELVIGQLLNARGRSVCLGQHSRAPSGTENAWVLLLLRGKPYFSKKRSSVASRTLCTTRILLLLALLQLLVLQFPICPWQTLPMYSQCFQYDSASLTACCGFHFIATLDSWFDWHVHVELSHL